VGYSRTGVLIGDQANTLQVELLGIHIDFELDWSWYWRLTNNFEDYDNVASI
jgi:hypothetical protein